MASKKGLSREQARELYDDLHRAMQQMMNKNGVKAPSGGASTGSAPADSKVAKEIANAIKDGLRGKGLKPPAPRESRITAQSRTLRPQNAPGGNNKGITALLVVLGFGFCKIVVDALAFMGVGAVDTAQASIVQAPKAAMSANWSKEEAKVLTSLDQRRVELQERSERLDERDTELNSRDRELASKLSELRDLTDKLKLERDKGEKQRHAQLDQLANVYGSMNPPEAAKLMEQLDVQIALSLIERMPEKRIGQILALMNQDKALALTNLLSNRAPR